jgi:hypothetical protein
MLIPARRKPGGDFLLFAMNGHATASSAKYNMKSPFFAVFQSKALDFYRFRTMLVFMKFMG